MYVFNKSFLSILGFFSFVEIFFSCESIGMLTDEDKSKGLVSAKSHEEKDREGDTDKISTKTFLERLYMLKGNTLKDNNITVDVDRREDKTWINQQGKRILIETR